MTIDRAAIIANAETRIAHHEAGHAVAAVARGGELLSITLGKVDWDGDPELDEPGGCRHISDPRNAPFVTFAGPWAEARWQTTQDPALSLDEALDTA